MASLFIIFIHLQLLGISLAAKKPNIIFILTDDQGSADVSYANPTGPIQTPNLDSLAFKASRLSNYYVHPTCTPTRAALMTGRYAANVGLSLALIPGNPAGLEPEYATLAEHLKSEGYKNHLVGKWHLGQSKEKYHPLRRGFDTFYGLLGAGFNHWTKQQGGGRFDWWRGWDPAFENKTHSTDLLNAEAVRVVQEAKEPYFLFLSYPAVHDPLAAPERHLQMCNHVENYRRRLSCAMVAGIDEGIGRIVKVLQSQGKLEETVIGFSIDNGGVPYAGALNYPLRGAKATLYEGGVRSPGFIHAPNFLPSQDFEPLFHVADFFPTFSALVKQTTNSSSSAPIANIDGVNQLPAMVAQAKEGPRNSVHIHRDYDRDGHAYRRGPWKVIVGHHCLPFFYTHVYNETKSRWIVENGGLRSKVLQLLQEAIDTVVGTEHSTFLQYALWIFFDSYNVGGLDKARQAARGPQASKGILNSAYPSDLNQYLERQAADPEYPLVSLFNLEQDPTESQNLANQYPELVKELLAEAELVLKDAPMQVRGDMVDAEGPMGPEQKTWGGWWSVLLTLGSEHPRVIPFGPYLDDDFNYAKLNYVRLFAQARADSVMISIKVFFACILIPALLLFQLVRMLR